MTDSVLGTDLGASVSWKAQDDRWNFRPPDGGQPIPDDCDLAGLFNDTWNIHKPDNYPAFYDRVCSPYRRRPIKLLEMGVARGGSLELWRKYFSAETVIVGLDGFTGCTRFNAPDRNIFVRHGQQQDRCVLESLVEEFGAFDIIIDDASHIPSHTLKSFRYLFLHGLNDGGVYVVEDLGLCYGAEFLEPFPSDHEANDGSPTFVEFVKHLVDVIHAHHQQAAENGFSDTLQALTPGQPGYMREFTVPLATTLIDGMEINDGIVAIHRNPRRPPRSLYKGTTDQTDIGAVSPEWRRRQSVSAQQMVEMRKF